LELILEKVPQLDPLLAAVWQVLSLTLLLNDGSGGWAHIDAFFGVLQGGHDGQPVYCLIVMAVERDFNDAISAMPEAIASSVQLWKFVDDGILQCPLQVFSTVWRAWCAANARHRIVLVDSKSVAYVPAWDGLPAPPADAAIVTEFMPLCRDGLVLLGGVTEGAYAVSLGSRCDINPTEKRGAKACCVARGLVAMSNEGLDVGGRQPAWQIARLVVAASLS
jgi:hypothetical protein